jgi:hypothetical protein
VVAKQVLGDLGETNLNGYQQQRWLKNIRFYQFIARNSRGWYPPVEKVAHWQFIGPSKLAESMAPNRGGRT